MSADIIQFKPKQDDLLEAALRCYFALALTSINMMALCLHYVEVVQADAWNAA